MPISDAYESFAPGLTGPAVSGFDITPDDGADLLTLPRALMVASSGDVAVQFGDGSRIVLPGLQPGIIYPVRPVRVLDAGTTASGLKGLL
ncbi:spike base protein, RCAP_Rcc01079 family [Primorskyibacter sp. S87]|uniref:spike base protein, RCAP_Rcc01079 family n=1 Tax=Primorskyibacter sp. S87 TaxID=3415126 RepID=UPI003C7CBB39